MRAGIAPRWVVGARDLVVDGTARRSLRRGAAVPDLEDSSSIVAARKGAGDAGIRAVKFKPGDQHHEDQSDLVGERFQST